MRSNILDQPLFRLVLPSFYGLMIYILILLINNNLQSLTEAIFTHELMLCVVLAYFISESVRLVIIQFEKRLVENLKKSGSLFAMIGAVFSWWCDYLSNFLSVLQKLKELIISLLFGLFCSNW